VNWVAARAAAADAGAGGSAYVLKQQVVALLRRALTEAELEATENMPSCHDPHTL
jgi:hypothetical protein